MARDVFGANLAPRCVEESGTELSARRGFADRVDPRMECLERIVVAFPFRWTRARQSAGRHDIIKEELEMAEPDRSTKKTSVKTAAKKTAARAGSDARTDPTDDYLARQPPEQRALLVQLRALVRKGVPDADVSIKWGVPFYQKNGKNV